MKLWLFILPFILLGCAEGSGADVSPDPPPPPSVTIPHPAQDDKPSAPCTIVSKQLVHDCTLFVLDCDGERGYATDCPPPPVVQVIDELPDPI